MMLLIAIVRWYLFVFRQTAHPVAVGIITLLRSVLSDNDTNYCKIDCHKRLSIDNQNQQPSCIKEHCRVRSHHLSDASLDSAWCDREDPRRRRKNYGTSTQVNPLWRRQRHWNVNQIMSFFLNQISVNLSMKRCTLKKRVLIFFIGHDK